MGFHGTGDVSYKAALTAILIEGFAFLFLAVTGIRHFIIKFIPEPVSVHRAFFFDTQLTLMKSNSNITLLYILSLR